ncbi:hypothetical protein JOB18_017736 [Solea senegalensis]|uniref:Uncharacterized protein n=1 Tax=Solea senegalensis TaxID=28829 RepID=A0AAV6R4I4_SOLSE|nr:hypothetical protein JOB18_017736 [Solea senegalensis]
MRRHHVTCSREEAEEEEGEGAGVFMTEGVVIVTTQLGWQEKWLSSHWMRSDTGLTRLWAQRDLVRIIYTKPD